MNTAIMETNDIPIPEPSMARNVQARKFILTICNPQEKNLGHDKIRLILSQLKSLIYFCMADDVGLKEHNLHTHIFIMSMSPVSFGRMKKLFPSAHIERAYGTAEENRAYVSKTGKWADRPKAAIIVAGSFEESGPLPAEPGQRTRADIAEIYQKIAAGMDNAEIMAENPDAARHIGKLDRIRQDILEARYRDQWRNLDVTYIFGPTATGKTLSVIGTHGYKNICRVVNYAHPFDQYRQQPVLCLDEFRSSLPIGDVISCLDGYPMALPARYIDRQACYTTVYLISNISLKAQYPKVQADKPEIWQAFLRRIHHVIEYRKDGSSIDHGDALTYISSLPPSPAPATDKTKAAKTR